MKIRGIILSILIISAAACGQPGTKNRESGTTAKNKAGPAIPMGDEGKTLYTAWCSACHGAHGKGDGPAALEVSARNFTKEPFKIRSTPSGQPPTRKDIFETITRGIPVSGMPSFAFLPEEDRWKLTDEVRRLAKIDTLPEPAPIALGKISASTPESLQRGKELYAANGCISCHGETGRGDGPASKSLLDDQGRPIPARDYTKGQYLGGDTPEAIHMRLRTGLDGTGMPAFSENLTMEQGWDMAHYVLSLRSPKESPSSDPIALGRQVVAERRCQSCHMIEGKGGDVGPSLDVAASKLRFDWIKNFLKNPPAAGKNYHYIPYQMPNFQLTDAEIDGIVAYFAKISGRQVSEPTDIAIAIDENKVKAGQLLYFLKCTECHNMGNVIPTPKAKQQGPDLIQVSRRIRYDWIPTWVNNPKQVYPLARMVDTNLTPEEIEQVRQFIWKTSVTSLEKAP
ncbi:MAG: c-type cytochrome [Deltaproteobacteria bacterium]|nr:c-type cytochrome [Deltaproteobacteria bacterium]